MLKKIYVVLAILAIGTYAAAAFRGWEFGGKRGFVPQDVRSKPGGLRTFHYFHGGYRGGK